MNDVMGKMKEGAKRAAWLLVMVSFVSVLAACGGGGGGSGENTPPAAVVSAKSFPINIAIANLTTAGFDATISLSGTINGFSVTGTGTYSWNPATAATFENQPALDAAVVVNMTVVANGFTQYLPSTTHQYFSNTYYPLGQVDASGGQYYVVTSFPGWPTAAKVGDTGILGTVTIYGDSNKTLVVGHQQLSYTIEADTADTVILNETIVETDASNAVVLTEHDRYRMTSAGAVTFVSSQGITAGVSSNANLTLTATSFQTPGTSPPPAPVPTPAPTPAPNPTPTPAPSPAPPTPLTVLHQSVAYQIDPAHSGHVAFGQALNFPATPTWSVTLSSAVSYPLIAGGKVFVLTGPAGGVGYGTQLYALDEATGNIVWGPVAIAGTYTWSGHAYDSGKLFVVNSDGLLRSFDAATGTPGWSTQLPGQYSFSSPPTAVNGVVYIGGAGSGGTLYAVNEANGNVLWTASVSNGDESSAAVSNEGVFVSYPCQVYKFDPATGATLWHYSGGCSGGGGRTPAYANGLLYVRDWTTSPAALIFDTTSGSTIGTFTATTIPALTSQTGFFQNQGTLQAVDLATHNVLWSFVGDGAIVSAPIVIDQVVIVGSTSGKVYAVDATSGTELWSGIAGTTISGSNEQNLGQPLTGLGAGEGYLVVPAGNVLTAWRYY